MGSKPSSSEPNQNTVAELKRQKLELEIKNLKIKNSWYRPLFFMLPPLALLATALVGFAGFRYSVSKDQEMKKQDRIRQIQTRINNDIDQLLLFPHDDKQTVARAVFLFRELRMLLDSSVDETRISDTPDVRNNVVLSLYNLTEYDCDFDKIRDIDFDDAAVLHLTEYSNYLREHPDDHSYIFTKYAEALERLCDKERAFRSLKYNPKTYDFEFIQSRPKQSLIDLFDDLREAFKDHFELLKKRDQLSQEIIKKNEEIKNIALKRFQLATCNPEFTQFELKENLDLNSDSTYIKRCGKQPSTIQKITH